MSAPALNELPSPPAGRTGWPWTEASDVLPPKMPDGSLWPKVSVVTPSFNQAHFLEATLRSILLQGYPNLELFVMDGGSNDGSVDIIRKYEPWLSGWVSEPDGGQSAAINRGLNACSGTFATWINSDDMLFRNALHQQALRVGFRTDEVYIGDCLYIDVDDRPLFLHRGKVHTFEDLVNIRTVWRASEGRGHIVQPEVLFPLRLVHEVGGLDPAKHWAMDYELWGKFLLAGAKFRYTEIPFGIFRLHAAQKTGQAWTATQALVATAASLVASAPHLTPADRERFTTELQAYERDYWRGTGPLARIGLPPGAVVRLRSWSDGLRHGAGRLVRSVLVTG